MTSFLLTAGELRARGGGKWGNHPPDVLPAWVADMDFRVAPSVHDAIRRFSDTQDYGYGLLTDLEPLYYPGPAGADGARHIPMETLAPERTVTLTSATKGFNIPAVRTAIAHFGSPDLKDRFGRAIPEHLLGWPSRFGVAGTIAAWRDGDAWLDEVLRYLERNRQVVSEWAADLSLGYHPPEATYLAWFDFQRLRLPANSSPYEHFLEQARVALSDGATFGEPGRGHVRLNFATSAEILDEILGRLSRALD